MMVGRTWGRGPGGQGCETQWTALAQAEQQRGKRYDRHVGSSRRCRRRAGQSSHQESGTSPHEAFQRCRKTCIGRPCERTTNRAPTRRRLEDRLARDGGFPRRLSLWPRWKVLISPTARHASLGGLGFISPCSLILILEHHACWGAPAHHLQGMVWGDSSGLGRAKSPKQQRQLTQKRFERTREMKLAG